jgi:hypothetical protein
MTCVIPVLLLPLVNLPPSPLWNSLPLLTLKTSVSPNITFPQGKAIVFSHDLNYSLFIN